MLPDTCPGWAPGRDLPMGVCVWCGAQRDDHPKAGQARSSGRVTPITRPELVFADSPISASPDVQSPASNAAKVRPDIVFCRHCNQGMVLVGVLTGSPEETQYPCPKCHLAGPKSKTPTGKVQAETHEQPAPDKTMGQRAFEDGLRGNPPVAGADALYTEWYAEGKKRRLEADASAGIMDGEFEDVTVGGVTGTTAAEPETAKEAT